MFNILKRLLSPNKVKEINSESPDVGTGIKSLAKADEYYQKIGTTIGNRFEIRDILGRGGCGVVYLAYCREIGESYALKTFLNEYMADASVREQFEKEVSIWIRLDSHPNIVRAHFADEISGRLYLGMELIPSSEEGYNTLDGFLRRKVPDFLQFLQWAIQFCRGIEYAYSKGIKAHRDIKPENIMIDRQGRLKITDFGLAGSHRYIDSSAKGQKNYTETAQGLAFGTPTHMPPEQFIDAASADEGSDIYSFGIVLYQMLSNGKLPFSPKGIANPWQELFEMHSLQPVTNIDSPAFSIIARCLEKKRHDRYQSFSEVRKDCEQLLVRHFGGNKLPTVPTIEELAMDDLIAKGYSLDMTGSHDAAIECYKKALEMGNDPVLFSNIALALIHKERYKDAIQYCNRSLEMFNDFSSAWINKAVALENIGQQDSALDIYKVLIERNANLHMAWFNAGNILFQKQQKQKALSFMDEAIAISPDYAPAFSNKAKILDDLGKHQEAIQCFKNALEINPMSFYAWTNAAVCLRNLNAIDESLSAFERALELNPQHAFALYEYGNTLLQLRRFEEAMDKYNVALDINPAEASVLAAKTMCFWQSGNIGDALMFSRIALSISNEPQLYFIKASIEDNAGMKKEAIATYEQFLRKQRNADRQQIEMARGRIFHLTS